MFALCDLRVSCADEVGRLPQTDDQTEDKEARQIRVRRNAGALRPTGGIEAVNDDRPSVDGNLHCA